MLFRCHELSPAAPGRAAFAPDFDNSFVRRAYGRGRCGQRLARDCRPARNMAHRDSADESRAPRAPCVEAQTSRGTRSFFDQWPENAAPNLPRRRWLARAAGRASGRTRIKVGKSRGSVAALLVLEKGYNHCRSAIRSTAAKRPRTPFTARWRDRLLSCPVLLRSVARGLDILSPVTEGQVRARAVAPRHAKFQGKGFLTQDGASRVRGAVVGRSALRFLQPDRQGHALLRMLCGVAPRFSGSGFVVQG